MIMVTCFTNLDDFRGERWPTRLTCKPVVGEKVRARSGKQLTIVAITHVERFNDTLGETENYLEIELHKGRL